MKARTRSGIFDISNAAALNIKSSIMKDFYAPDCRGLYSQANDIKIYIESTTTTCKSTFNELDIKPFYNMEVANYTTTTSFQIINAVNISNYYNTFTKCGIASTGGVFYITNSPFYDYGSKYLYNAGAAGGVIKCTKCQMNMTYSKFTYNYAHRGGVLSIDSNATMSARLSKFLNNIAYSSGGVMYVSTESYFNITSSVFEENFANLTSTIEILGSSSTKNCTLIGCRFALNTAIKNTASFMYSKVYV